MSFGVSAFKNVKFVVDDTTVIYNQSTGKIEINLSNANTWTAIQTFNNNISFGGANLNVIDLIPNDILQYNGTDWVNVILATSGVTSVSNSDETLTISPTSGSVIASLNLANANTWSGIQTLSTLNTNASQTTIAGLTAGSIIVSMPFQGDSYKKIVIYLDNYENDTTTLQAYTYPTAFVNTPVIATNDTGANPISVTATEFTINLDSANIYKGIITIEGY